jgi:hypothetical protein
MRLNIDFPDWEYIRFKNRVGDGNMSNYIREIVRLTNKGVSQEDIAEREQDIIVLRERVEKLKDEVKIAKGVYDEVVNTLRLAESDLKASEISTRIQETENQKEKDAEHDIKLNTYKDRLGDI